MLNLPSSQKAEHRQSWIICNFIENGLEFPDFYLAANLFYSTDTHTHTFSAVCCWSMFTYVRFVYYTLLHIWSKCDSNNWGLLFCITYTRAYGIGAWTFMWTEKKVLKYYMLNAISDCELKLTKFFFWMSNKTIQNR